MEKIKVLQINKQYYPVIGGVEKVVQQIAEGLNERYNMKVLVCQSKGRSSDELINGVNIRRAQSFGVLFSMPVSIGFFFDYLRLRKDRDIVHIHMPFPLADLAIYLFGFKGKVVLSWHSDIVRQKRLLVLYRPFLEALLKRADKIIVATPGHINGSDYLQVYKHKCVVIPYALEDKVIEAAEKYALERKPNLKPIILFVGRLVYYKGCEVLIEALSMIKSDAVLKIVGNGPLRNKLIDLSRNLGISNKVEFLGDVDDQTKYSYFAQADIFVLPSVAKSEAFGLVQLEAMAFSLPVINTSLDSGAPYVSLHEETGLTVPPNDSICLADAMDHLILNEELREKYGKAARHRVEEAFAMKDMLDKIYDGLD